MQVTESGECLNTSVAVGPRAGNIANEHGHSAYLLPTFLLCDRDWF